MTKKEEKKPAQASEASSTQLPKPSVVTTRKEQSKQVESTVRYLTGENEKLRQMNEDLQEHLTGENGRLWNKRMRISKNNSRTSSVKRKIQYRR